MLKTYTINKEGRSNGNVIPSGFTIKVMSVSHYSTEAGEGTVIETCTENAAGMCGNDDISARENFDIQAMSSSSNAVLVSTLEAKLDSVYGSGNWTK